MIMMADVQSSTARTDGKDNYFVNSNVCFHSNIFCNENDDDDDDDADVIILTYIPSLKSITNCSFSLVILIMAVPQQ